MQTVKQGSRPMAGNAFVSFPCKPSDIKSLYYPVGTGDRYRTLKDGGSDYQVPVGKVFVILGYTSASGNASSQNDTIGYGDTAVSDSASAPTNFIGPGLGIQAGAYSNTPNGRDIVFKVPAGKYPCYRAGATQGGFVWGVEVPA